MFLGWYDRKEIGSFRHIEDVNFVCAMAPPGGGRNPITPRLLRHFHVLAFPMMEDDTKVNTDKIFQILCTSPIIIVDAKLLHSIMASISTCNFDQLFPRRKQISF